MSRFFFLIAAVLIFISTGCASQTVQPEQTTPTLSPTPRISLPATITAPPPTATIPLLGSPTPTPIPTDENSLKPILRSPAELANQGKHAYKYSCAAWAPCQCLVVVPTQIEITFNFSARSVDLQAGDYTQAYLWSAASSYINELGTLATQLTFFEDGFELYSVIDNRSCTQERYTLSVETP